MLEFEKKTSKSKVDVHSMLTVVSSTPVKPGEVHKFSALDQAMAPHSAHLVFYYRNNPGGPFDLDRLRMSLSKMLSAYPPVTGRLSKNGEGGWEVNCNDAGVRVFKARVGATLDQWLSSAEGWEERDLTAWEGMPEDPTMWSPFRIQFNDFKDGGLAIGLSCSHMHADLTCAAMLFQTWALTLRHQPVAHPPSFQRPWTKQPSSGHGSQSLDAKSVVYVAAKSKSVKPNSVKMATATFKFSDAAVKQCLAEMHRKCSTATPFDLLAAIFWRAVEYSKGGVDAKHSLSICVDFRKLLSEPLPLGYFGNAQNFSQLSVTDEDLKVDNWLEKVTEQVSNHVASINNEEVQSAIDWLESRSAVEGKSEGTAFRMYGPELTCISMEHLIDPNSGKSVVYETRFEEDERPVHVSCHIGNADGEGLIFVMSSPEGGLSRSVVVTIPEDQLAKVCKDEAIRDLKPTMIISGM